MEMSCQPLRGGLQENWLPLLPRLMSHGRARWPHGPGDTFCTCSLHALLTAPKHQWQVSCHPLKEKWPQSVHFCSCLLPYPLRPLPLPTPTQLSLKWHFIVEFFLSCQSESICLPLSKLFWVKRQSLLWGWKAWKRNYLSKEGNKVIFYFGDHLRSTLNNFQMYDKILLIIVTQHSENKIMASSPITSWQIDGETVETVAYFIFLGSKITADGDRSQEIKMLTPWKESYDQPRQHIKKQIHYFINKGPSS